MDTTKMARAEVPKQETDIERIMRAIVNINDLALEIRNAARKLHEPVTPQPTIGEEEKPPSPPYIGLQLYATLSDIRRILRDALDALKGFN